MRPDQLTYINILQADYDVLKREMELLKRSPYDTRAAMEDLIVRVNDLKKEIKRVRLEGY